MPASKVNEEKSVMNVKPKAIPALFALQCSEADPAIMIGTRLELDQALHRAELHCTSHRPIIVSLYAHGHRLGIGVGLRDSFVSFQRFEPTPGPSLITVGDAPSDHGAIFFFLGWRRTEIPRRHLLPMANAREILGEFFETGVRSTIVEWEAFGAKRHNAGHSRQRRKFDQQKSDANNKNMNNNPE